MKIPRDFPRKNVGVALVLTLAALLLILVLAIAFLSRVASERSAAAHNEAGVSARTLADTAVSLVQAQIDVGTKVGAGKSWTSQPGMVRVFNGSGQILQALKLYSSSQMSAATVDFQSDIPGNTTWPQEVATWVDLNEPMMAVSGTVYPILDPNAASSTSALGPVQGFALPTSGSAAMPVQWLYALQDGSLVSPTSTGAGGVLTFDSATVTTSNPIVGRIAFWTDDDTCKVNINTAGEGIFWDVPRFMSTQDQGFGKNQPALREYTRYAGHPATTSLSAVFPNLTAEQILSTGLLPRYDWGGSLAGTVVATSPVSTRDDRLYASVAEAIYDPSRNPSVVSPTEIQARCFFLTAQSRAPQTNLFNLPRVAIWPLDVNDDSQHRTVFDDQIARCATINGQPYYFQRQDALSPTNDLSNIPRNLQLYNYLDTLMGTTIPGFSGNFHTKYGTDSPQILTEVFDFIRSANLVDPLLEAQSDGVTFAPKAAVNVGVHSMVPGYGSAAPIHHPTNGTMGFGRFYTLAEFALQFICTGDGNTNSGTDPNGVLNNNIPPGGLGSPANLTLATNTPLANDGKRIMAIVHLRFFSPAQGWVTMQPQMTVEVSGLNTFTLGGNPLFPAAANGEIELGRRGPDSGHLGSAFGGNAGTGFPLFSKRAPGRGNLPADSSGTAAEDLYPFISNPVTVATGTAAPPTMAFIGGPVTVKIFSGNSLTGSKDLVQTINLTVPPGNFPFPNLPITPPTKYLTTDPQPGYAAQYWWSPGQGGAVPSVEGHGRLFGAAVGTGHPMVAGEGYFLASTGSYFHENDVVRSMVLSHGDHRLTAGRETVPTGFEAHPDWNVPSVRFANHLYNDLPAIFWPPATLTGSYVNGVGLPSYALPDIPKDRPSGLNVVTTRDWDQGTARAVDGAYINKPDEGNTYDASWGPYMYGGNITGDVGATFFSPNRQMPSPGIFGSLPTQIKAGTPWRTLLFRPQASGPTHPASAVAPKDHLLMDLFWMPVVEPYAISEPFSTAGMVNMNYQMIPFTQIERKTGMYAILKGEKLGAVPIAASEGYLYKRKDSPLSATSYRLNINIPETLKQFDQRFGTTGADVFRSASEICDLWIVPTGGQTLATMPTFWIQNRLTGENVRERIYTTLYPRLTVRSNTFTVHVWSQALKNPPGQTANVWDESKGVVTGSYRGSTSIERFIDPNNPTIPDYAASPAAITTATSLDDFYRWRVVGNDEFAP